MKKGLLLLLLVSIFSCSKEPSVSPQKTDALTSKLDSLHQQDFFRGFAVAVVNEQGLLYNRGFGYADVKTKKPYTEETIINIASVSKMFVGVALLKAVEQGLVALDDPVSKHLPFEVKNPHHPDSPITIRQLATHTSSIVDGDVYLETDYINKDNISIDSTLQERYGLYYKNPAEDWMPLADYLVKLLQAGEQWYEPSTYANWAPGDQFEYSNIGTALCALVVESASNMPFYAFTDQYIFQPLGMSSTAWRFEDVDMTAFSKLYYEDVELPYYRILSYPDGALISSSTDLGLFLSELINGYMGQGKLLGAASYVELFKSQLNATQLGEKEGFNAGLFTEKYLEYNDIGHSGGDPSVNTLLFFDTETRVGKVMILNTDSDKENNLDAYWGIWNALDDYQKESDNTDA